MPRIRHLATRFALLLAAAAVVPLLAYGIISVISLERATRESVVAGNVNVATRAVEEMRRYVSTNAELLKALAADLQNTGLEQWQQDRILKNYVLQFREFREIALFDEAGIAIASSRVGPPRLTIPTTPAVTLNGVSMSPITIDDDLLPTAVFSIHLRRLDQPSGWLIGQFSLEEMWRMVDRIRIGERGFAMVVGKEGEIVAHGDPDKKALVAQARSMLDNAIVTAARAQSDQSALSQEYLGEDGQRELGAAARIDPLGWIVVVEQPTSEAFASATRLRRQLIVAISLAVMIMVSIGYLFGRSFLRPIRSLQRGTQAVAAGQLDTRVNIESADEFADLGAAFNSMAGRLAELQEAVKREARLAMFGRVASGLTHDVMQPILGVINNARLLGRDDLDAETRQTARKLVEREGARIKRFMDDLRNVLRPQRAERFLLDVNHSVAEILDPMRSEGQSAGVTVEATLAPQALVIEADLFTLQRVFRNLILNAIQATQPGGRVDIATARHGDLAEIRISDTGSGISPERLPTIFEDFVTTKRRGLGLGLAVSKRLVDELGGTITVESELGRGTTFALRFALRQPSELAEAAS